MRLLQAGESNLNLSAMNTDKTHLSGQHHPRRYRPPQRHRRLTVDRQPT